MTSRRPPRFARAPEGAKGSSFAQARGPARTSAPQAEGAAASARGVEGSARQARRPEGTQRAARASEFVCVTGVGAARAVLGARPEDVLGIAYTPDARGALADILRTAAQHHIAYREVSREELARMSDTVHHEGVSLRVRPRRPVALSELTRKLSARGFLVALDKVDNPHNIGALLRTAAYFGAAGLLYEGERDTELGAAVTRVAEGGAEAVPVCVVGRLSDALTTLKASGLAVIGADAHQGAPLSPQSFPARTVLVLGSERHGLSAEVKQRCDAFVCIAGTNAVESLNVSVAAGILMASAYAAATRNS